MAGLSYVTLSFAIVLLKSSYLKPHKKIKSLIPYKRDKTLKNQISCGTTQIDEIIRSFRTDIR